MMKQKSPYVFQQHLGQENENYNSRQSLEGRAANSTESGQGLELTPAVSFLPVLPEFQLHHQPLLGGQHVVMSSQDPQEQISSNNILQLTIATQMAPGAPTHPNEHAVDENTNALMRPSKNVVSWADRPSDYSYDDWGPSYSNQPNVQDGSRGMTNGYTTFEYRPSGPQENGSFHNNTAYVNKQPGNGIGVTPGESGSSIRGGSTKPYEFNPDDPIWQIGDNNLDPKKDMWWADQSGRPRSFKNPTVWNLRRRSVERSCEESMALGLKCYPEQVTVEVKVVIVRVTEIDTISQQFEAEIYIQSRWAESQFAGMSEQELEEIEFYQCWNPELKILNLIGEPENERSSMLLRYEEDRVYPVLTFMWHLKGLFRESLELQHFPLDVQELSIVLSTERPLKDLELMNDFAHLSSVNSRALQDSQEWTSYRHIEFTRDIRTSELMSTTRHPILKASAHVKRNIGYYFWNIAIIVMLILGLTFCLLAIDPTGTDRIGVTVTLFLTAVAFKLVVKTSLPPISYLTYLDIYVVFTLIYLGLQAAENATMCHLAKYREREKVILYDEISQATLISLLILFHLVFFIYIQLTALKRRREIEKKDFQYELSKASRRAARRGNRSQVQATPPPLPGTEKQTQTADKVTA